jgi:hypothetical protein
VSNSNIIGNIGTQSGTITGFENFNCFWGISYC